MIYKAFDVADEYRNPVMICADGMLGQMMEPVAIPDPIPAMSEEEIFEAKKPKGVAVISEISGKVTKIDEPKQQVTVLSDDGSEVVFVGGFNLDDLKKYASSVNFKWGELWT